MKRFTVIELLAAVAVIALLAGMLLPVLSKTREKGFAISCLSNLNQIGNADAQYRNDYGFYTPVSCGMGENQAKGKPSFAGVYLTSATTDYTQNGFLTPYLKGAGTKIFFCPEPKYRAARESFSDANGGYGANTKVHGRMNASTAPLQKNITNSSRIISFGDAAGYAMTKKIEETKTETDLAKLFTISLSNISVHFRHSGTVNLIYADGHGGYAKPGHILNPFFLIGGTDPLDTERAATESFDPDYIR